MDPYNYVLYQYELVGGQDCSYGDWQDLDIYKSIKGTDWQDELGDVPVTSKHTM